MEKLALQKAVAEKWLKAIADPSVKKPDLKLDPSGHESHIKRLSSPPPVLHSFAPLIKRVIDSGDKYRIAYLGIVLIQFYQGKELSVALPGNWEDDADLRDGLNKFLLS